MRLGLSVFFFVISALSGFGQKIYRDGYVIKNSNDTLNGLVQFEEYQKVENKCIFKRFDVAFVVEYNAEQIKGFGYTDGNFYESFNINGQYVFLECLVRGNLSLYYDGSNEFYCKTDEDFIRLKGRGIYSLSGVEKSTIYEYFVAKNGNLSAIISPTIKANVPQLIEVVKAFNQQGHSDFIVYNREYRKEIFDEAIMFSGINRFGYGVTSVLNTSSSEFTADYYVFDNLPSVSAKSNDWSFGLFCTYKFSRINTKWTIQGEINILNRSNYYYWFFHQKSLDQIVDLQTDMTVVKLPLLVRYTFTKGKLQPFINAGLSINYAFLKYKDATLTTESNLGEVYEYNNLNGETDRVNFKSLFAGGGFKYKVFRDKYISLEARYEISPGFGYSFDFDYKFSPTFNVSQDESFFQIIFGLGI